MLFVLSEDKYLIIIKNQYLQFYEFLRFMNDVISVPFNLKISKKNLLR